MKSLKSFFDILSILHYSSRLWSHYYHNYSLPFHLYFIFQISLKLISSIHLIRLVIRMKPVFWAVSIVVTGDWIRPKVYHENHHHGCQSNFCCFVPLFHFDESKLKAQWKQQLRLNMLDLYNIGQWHCNNRHASVQVLRNSFVPQQRPTVACKRKEISSQAISKFWGKC